MSVGENPTGAGEPGTLPIANAVFSGTGKAIDTLPFTDHGLA